MKNTPRVPVDTYSSDQALTVVTSSCVPEGMASQAADTMKQQSIIPPKCHGQLTYSLVGRSGGLLQWQQAAAVAAAAAGAPVLQLRPYRSSRLYWLRCTTVPVMYVARFTLTACRERSAAPAATGRDCDSRASFGCTAGHSKRSSVSFVRCRLQHLQQACAVARKGHPVQYRADFVRRSREQCLNG